VTRRLRLSRLLLVVVNLAVERYDLVRSIIPHLGKSCSTIELAP
jgi:hypothetical protein